MSNNCVWRETTACKSFPWEPESQPTPENMKMLYQVYTMCAEYFDVSCDTDLRGSWSHHGTGALLWVMLSGPAAELANPPAGSLSLAGKFGLHEMKIWLAPGYTTWEFELQS